MEVDDGACSSGDEEQCVALSKHPHTLDARLDLGDEKTANIVCRAVSVDKEPNRSTVVRSITTEGRFILISLKSADRRSLQKSIANLFEMCELSRQTVDMCNNKPWLDRAPPPSKKSKNKM